MRGLYTVQNNDFEFNESVQPVGESTNGLNRWVYRVNMLQKKQDLTFQCFGAMEP